MATNHTQTAGGEFPEDPEELLPEESVLSLDEYLAMHAAVGIGPDTRSSTGSSTAVT